MRKGVNAIPRLLVEEQRQAWCVPLTPVLGRLNQVALLPANLGEFQANEMLSCLKGRGLTLETPKLVL